jgi:predicted secreted protein
MKHAHLAFLGALSATLGGGTQAQSLPLPATAASMAALGSAPLVQLSTTAQTEVMQDWLVMTLSVQKEGAQAGQVQKLLKQATTAAIAVAKSQAQPGVLEISTGNINVGARYGRDNKINGWSGAAQLVLQGTDAEQIGALAGRLPEFTVSQVEWVLSPDAKRDAEMRIQAQAVDRFKTQAQALTRQFGFASYSLKEVRIGVQEASDNPPMLRMAAAPMDASAGNLPVPTVAGKTRVVVTVSGSVELK